MPGRWASPSTRRAGAHEWVPHIPCPALRDEPDQSRGPLRVPRRRPSDNHPGRTARPLRPSRTSHRPSRRRATAPESSGGTSATAQVCVALRGRFSAGGRDRRADRPDRRAHGVRVRCLPPERSHPRRAPAPDTTRRVGRDGGGEGTHVRLPPHAPRPPRDRGAAIGRPTGDRLPGGCRARRAPAERWRGPGGTAPGVLRRRRNRRGKRPDGGRNPPRQRAPRPSAGALGEREPEPDARRPPRLDRARRPGRLRLRPRRLQGAGPAGRRRLLRELRHA